jgi:hypothetical protein
MLAGYPQPYLPGRQDGPRFAATGIAIFDLSNQEIIE